MNIVIISGKIISNIKFDFIYNKDRKEKHTSIARCKFKLNNESVVDVYGYDEIADYLYRNNGRVLCIEGEIDSNMMIKVNDIT